MNKKTFLRIGNYTVGSCFDKEFNLDNRSICIQSHCYFDENVRCCGKGHLDIGFSVHIGKNVSIEDGCNFIGNGAVIKDFAIVDMDIPNYAIVYPGKNNQAEIMGYRFNEETRKLLDDSHWYYYSPEALIKYEQYLGDAKEFAKAIIDDQNAYGYL